jgi:ABC-2 type transport system permease protein
LSFFLYQGFDFIAAIPGLQAIDTVILNLGINEHYKSISRGVIDSRDIIYYIVVIVLFILITKTKLQSRKW